MKLNATNAGAYLVCHDDQNNSYLRLESVTDGGIVWYQFTDTGWEAIDNGPLVKTLETSISETVEGM